MITKRKCAHCSANAVNLREYQVTSGNSQGFVFLFLCAKCVLNYDVIRVCP